MGATSFTGGGNGLQTKYMGPLAHQAAQILNAQPHNSNTPLTSVVTQGSLPKLSTTLPSGSTALNTPSQMSTFNTQLLLNSLPAAQLRCLLNSTLDPHLAQSELPSPNFHMPEPNLSQT